MSGYFLKLPPGVPTEYVEEKYYSCMTADKEHSPLQDRARVFFVDAPSKNLICPLCQDVFDDPVISECGHTFCRQCISRHKSLQCPVHQDRNLSVVVDNLAVREQIGDLNVRCQYGVRWITPDPQDSLAGIDSSAASTLQSSTGATGGASVVGVLVEDGCPAVIKYNEKGAHEQLCDFSLAPCPNSTECPPIRKKDLQDHLLRCRLARCRYHTHGCTFAGNDSQLVVHETTECRFEPMKEYFRQVDEKLLEQNEQMKEKDQEITFLRSMVTKLSERVDELEQKVDTIQEASARTELDVVDLRRDLDANVENGSRRGSLFSRDHSLGNGGPLRCIGTFVGHEGPVWCLGESGGCLYSGSSDTTIKVWDVVETYQCMKTLVGHKDIVLSLHIVDGKLFSGSSDLCFNVWRLDTYSLIRRVKAHDNAVCTITSSDDRLFTGSLMKIKVWDMSSFALVKELDGTNWFRALAVNESLLFAGSKESILVCDLKNYEILRTLEFSGGSIYSLAIVDKRYLFGGTQENNIQVWDLTTFEKLPELQGHTGAVYALTGFRMLSQLLPDSGDDEAKSMLVSGAYDRSLRVWTMNEQGQFVCTQTLTRHSGSVSCLLSCAGRVYSGAIDSTIKVWCHLN